jgi:hypothetical protein
MAEKNNSAIISCCTISAKLMEKNQSSANINCPKAVKPVRLRTGNFIAIIHFRQKSALQYGTVFGKTDAKG